MLDGKSVGVTPLTVRDVEPGAHVIRLVRDGYVAAERRVSVTRARPSQTLAVELSRQPAAESAAVPVPTTPGNLGRNTGVLFVDSRPAAANVYVDGKLVGTTPVQVENVEPGSHVVRLERDGYGPWSSAVRVTTGERVRVSASLER